MALRVEDHLRCSSELSRRLRGQPAKHAAAGHLEAGVPAEGRGRVQLPLSGLAGEQLPDGQHGPAQAREDPGADASPDGLRVPRGSVRDQFQIVLLATQGQPRGQRESTAAGAGHGPAGRWPVLRWPRAHDHVHQVRESLRPGEVHAG